MGYKLRRSTADSLPSWVKGTDRLVVLELADQARDETGIAYGRELLATVARRSGLANAKAVGKALGRLADKGLELRVQVVREDGTPMFDALGRPVFAYDGRSTTYKIPAFATAPEPSSAPAEPDDGQDQTPSGPPSGSPSGPSGPPLGGPLPGEGTPAGDHCPPEVPQPGGHFSTGDDFDGLSGPPNGGPQTSSGPPAGGQWSPSRGSVVPQPGVSGPPAGGPLSSVSPHFPSLSPQSVVADAREREALAHLSTAYGLTDSQAAIVWSGAQKMARGRIDSPVPYLKAMAFEGTLSGLVQAVQLAPADGEGQEDEHDDPDLQVVEGHGKEHRGVAEALAEAYQTSLLVTLDGSAAPGPDEARARRGADLARELMAERAARRTAQ